MRTSTIIGCIRTAVQGFQGIGFSPLSPRLTCGRGLPVVTLSLHTKSSCSLLSRFPFLFVVHRVYMIYLKLALALIYSFVRSNLDDQVVMFWGVITFWTVWSCTHPPYRCRSSNR